MFEIKVTVEAPELAKAITLLASSIKVGAAGPQSNPETVLHTFEPAKPVTATAVPAPVAPVANSTPAAAVAPIAPAPVVGAPLPTAAPIAPVAAAPQITIEQIGKAGADLISQNPGAMPQLMALLQKYGVQSAQQLKPDQIGAFATEMRALGAKV